MANLARVRMAWVGSPVVGEGVSTFYFAEAHTGFVADTITFANALAAYLPTQLTLWVENSGDIIDDATGDLAGVWTDGTAGGAAGGQSNGWVDGVGTRIQWNTTGITSGRRVRGSTFVVPLDKGQFDTDGSIVGTTIQGITAATSQFLASADGNMRIFTRPKAGSPGKSSTVASATVPDKVSWLRSRRT